MADVPWDGHGDIGANHRIAAKSVDQPIGALLADLKARGLLDETLGDLGRRVRAHFRFARPRWELKGRDHAHASGGMARNVAVTGRIVEFRIAILRGIETPTASRFFWPKKIAVGRLRL